MSRTNRTRALRFAEGAAARSARPDLAMLALHAVAALFIAFFAAVLLFCAGSTARLSAPSNAFAPAAAYAAEDGKTFAPIERDATATDANLVLIVEFADAPDESYYNLEYPYPAHATYLSYFKDQLNGETSLALQHTYRAFLKAISKGKFDVMSYLPQEYDDETHLRIKVNRTASEYLDGKLSDSELLAQVIAQLNAARPDLDASIFDNHGSGNIDNVMLVICTSTDQDITYHETNSIGHPVVGSGSSARMVKDVTFVSGGKPYKEGEGYNHQTLDRFVDSRAAHERLHTFGARDLYRGNNKAGDPVEYWDLMAKGDRHSWPLAYTRQLIGWIDIPTLDVSSSKKSITLFAPEDADDKAESKPQAFIIKTPYSDSEYFVIEYRKKGGTTIDPVYRYDMLDPRIGSSGLIVYRVNEQYRDKGNYDGNDFVYVFRPGETSLTASVGDISKAAICAPGFAQGSGISSIGSLDSSAQITDGAICYSSGVNSCLKITATAQTDNSITVTVEQAQANAAAWEPVLSADGKSLLRNLSSPATKLATDGTSIYALAEDRTAQSWMVCKHDGSNWTQMGTKQTNKGSTDIAWFNGTLYAISAPTSGSSATLMRLNGDSWQNVAAIADCASYSSPRLSVINGKLYVLVSDSSKLTVYELDGTKANRYGPTIPGIQLYSPTLVSIAGKPAVAFGTTGTSPWATNLYTLANGAWIKQTLISGGAASCISTAMIGATTYMYASYSSITQNSSTKAQLFTFDASGKLTSTATIPQVNYSSAGAKLLANGSDLYLCAGNAQQGTLAYKLPGGSVDSITQVGDIAYAKYYDVSGCVANNRLYVAVSDTDAHSIAVRSHAIEASTAPSTPTTPTTPTDPTKPTDPTTPTNPTNPSTPTTPGNPSTPGTAPGNPTNPGSSSGGTSSGTPSTSPPATQAMHRLYNPNSGEHFYTAEDNERDTLIGLGWEYEGTGWTAPQSSNAPVYRLYNANAGDHHYTMSAGERDTLVGLGWSYEGIGWYSDEQQRVPLYRQYNPNAIAGSHNYTTNAAERDMLVGLGWHDEEIAWYGL